MERYVTFTMMIGLPGAGKSTYANMQNAVIVSSDSIREELNIDVPFGEMRGRTKKALLSGSDVIYDATNLRRKNRREVLAMAKSLQAKTVAVVIATPLETVFEQNRRRERIVPEDVIQKYVRSFEFPAPEEFDEIKVIQNSISNSPVDTNITQDNPHHTLSLEEHLKKTAELVDDDKILKLAALNHDIGKPFVKSFLDGRGRETDVAHYYGHECFGAYHYLTHHPYNEEAREVVQLINYHMRPYVWEKSAKAKGKDFKDFGMPFTKKLLLLHMADRRAH